MFVVLENTLADFSSPPLPSFLCILGFFCHFLSSESVNDLLVEGIYGIGWAKELSWLGKDRLNTSSIGLSCLADASVSPIRISDADSINFAVFLFSMEEKPSVSLIFFVLQ